VINLHCPFPTVIFGILFLYLIVSVLDEFHRFYYRCNITPHVLDIAAPMNIEYSGE
jgi:hypothetical protein